MTEIEIKPEPDHSIQDKKDGDEEEQTCQGERHPSYPGAERKEQARHNQEVDGRLSEKAP